MTVFYQNITGQLISSFQVTIADNDTQYGFIEGNFGAISPLSYKGNDIERIIQSPGSNVITITIDGTGHPQDHFQTIILEGTGGPLERDFNEATFFSDSFGGRTIWQFNDGSLDWPSDVGLNRTMQLVE